MKKYLESYFIASVIVAALILLPNLSQAQPGDPGDDPDAPIDGGVSLLVAAGVGYGIKKNRDAKKKSRATAEFSREA